MPNPEKEILRLIAKYAEIEIANFTELDHRLLILEKAMAADPQLLATYNQAVRDVKPRNFPPALPVQLSAIRSAIEKLRD